MKWLNWRYLPLAPRLTMVMTLIIVMAVGGVTYLSIRREQQNFQRELEQQTELLLDTLEIAATDALYTLDADYLEGLMEELGDSGTVVESRIYDRDGRVIADAITEDTLVYNTKVDPFGEQLIQTDSFIIEWQQDKDTLLAGKPIIVGRQHIGAISVEMPTAQLQDKTADVRNQGILVGAVAAFTGVLLSLLFARSITRPLKQLTVATRKMATGDMLQEVNIDSGGELALLTLSFNSMSRQLRELIKHLEQRAKELEIARAEAVEASRMKDLFLARMSHELRTPLNAIIGYSDLMIGGIYGAITEKQKERLQRVMDNGKHLLQLINDVLDLSRIEAGQMELHPETFNLSALLSSASTAIQSLAEKSGNTLELHIPDNLEMRADMMKVRQIAVNLLSNAIKFTENGTITLTITPFDKAGEEWFKFEVADTGIGMKTREQSEKAFKAFVQADSSTTRKYGGTGLGLAITAHFCQMMGGTITADSKVGEGSIFTVTLPCQIAHGAEILVEGDTPIPAIQDEISAPSTEKTAEEAELT